MSGEISDQPVGSRDSDSEISSEEIGSSSHHALPTSMREISFGALASAQESLMSQSAPPLHQSRHQQGDPEKLQALRARLAELKGVKSIRTKSASKPENDNSNQPPARASKHAPTEQSSRRAVTRKRNVIDLPSDPHHSRDPRFSSLSTARSRVEEGKLNNNYAFLSSYRDSELNDLKAMLDALKSRAKKRKSGQFLASEADEVQTLKREINRIENKKKSEEAREREREVIRRHRKEEREAIKQGKTPYYLKHGEARKVAEKERWDGLKGREKRKLQERREKKKSRKGRGVEVLDIPEQ